jgi:hypothetical protein
MRGIRRARAFSIRRSDFRPKTTATTLVFLDWGERKKESVTAHLPVGYDAIMGISHF